MEALFFLKSFYFRMIFIRDIGLAVIRENHRPNENHAHINVKMLTTVGISMFI